jgi:TetR/AcrR family transcriptional regulator, cholesterol catabolism regulator
MHDAPPSSPPTPPVLAPTAPLRGGYEPARTRELLIESALTLFGEKGFRGTSVQEIVQSAGLTKGAFYHHFASKEDVLWLIQNELFAAHERLIAGILESFASPVDQLGELVRGSVFNATRYRAYLAVFVQERIAFTGEREVAMKRAWHDIESKMEDIVLRGIESGDFDATVHPRVAVTGIVGMMTWVQQWYRPDGHLSAEDVADGLAQMTLSGMRRR